MFSRSSINGSELNTLAINAGNFVLEMDSGVTVTATAEAIITPRRGMTADISGSLGSQAGLLRRVTPRAHSVTAIDSVCVLLRRPVIVGKIDLAANLETMLIRRISHQLTATVRLVSTATPAWRALRAAPPARTIRVTDYRLIAVMRENRSALIGAERRVVDVPRDREAIQ